MQLLGQRDELVGQRNWIDKRSCDWSGRSDDQWRPSGEENRRNDDAQLLSHCASTPLTRLTVGLQQVFFALSKGAAIFMPQDFALEGLEQRTHLAAAPLSAFYPLIRGSTWSYDIVDYGKHLTSIETIATQTKRIHGERAFQRISDWSDGSRGITFENFSAAGQLHLHRAST